MFSCKIYAPVVAISKVFIANSDSRSISEISSGDERIDRTALCDGENETLGRQAGASSGEIVEVEYIGRRICGSSGSFHETKPIGLIGKR